MLAVADANLALALALTPELGLEGPALATAVPFVAAFPFMLRLGLRASGADIRQLADQAWLPAYLMAGCLALALVAVRLLVNADAAQVALGSAGMLLSWAAFYRLALAPGERQLVLGLIRRSG